MAPSSSSSSSGSDSDMEFDDDMEALRRACMVTGTDPADVGSSDADSDGESRGSDDVGLLRRLQERYSAPEADSLIDAAPLCTKPPPSPDEEDDFETLRAIRRRFAQYHSDSLHKKSLKIIEEPDIVDHDVFHGPPTPNMEPNKNQVVALIGDGGVNLVGNLIPSKLPKSGQNFVDALKQNRSCQKFIRRKMIEIEAKIEKVKELKERMKCLMDFQVASKRRLGNAFRQKKDPRIRLISVEERRTAKASKVSGCLKTSWRKVPSFLGPAENSHVSKYRMVLKRFPVSMCKQPWSKVEKENLVKGLKQLYQEMLILNSFNCDSDTEELADSNLMSLLTSSDLEVSPEQIRSFIPSVDWDRLVSMYVVGRSGAECEARWLNCEDPMINHSPWTGIEEKKLLFIVQERGVYDWIDISVALGTYRTPFQCLARYQRSLNPHILNKNWTEDEDAKLRVAVENYGDDNWQAVASCLEGRSNTQCSNRWKNTLNPERGKIGRWSVDEDKRLKAAVVLFGAKNWKKIAKFAPGRTEAQCRERWHNCLNPSLNLKPWTAEEDAKLLAAISKHGHCWSRVANFVPPRTDSQCRRRWKILCPDEVPLAQAATQLKKTVLISNFVTRKRERPAIGPNDFTPPVQSDMQVNLGAECRKSKTSDNTAKRSRVKCRKIHEQVSAIQEIVPADLALGQTGCENIGKSRKEKASGDRPEKLRYKQKGRVAELSMANEVNSHAADCGSSEKTGDTNFGQPKNSRTNSRLLAKKNSTVHATTYTSSDIANDDLPLMDYINSRSSNGRSIKRKRTITRNSRSKNSRNKSSSPSKEIVIPEALLSYPADITFTDFSFMGDMSARDAGGDTIERIEKSLSGTDTQRPSETEAESSHKENLTTVAVTGSSVEVVPVDVSPIRGSYFFAGASSVYAMEFHNSDARSRYARPIQARDIVLHCPVSENVSGVLDSPVKYSSQGIENTGSSNNLTFRLSKKASPVQRESLEGHVATGFSRTDGVNILDQEAGFVTVTLNKGFPDKFPKSCGDKHQLERVVNVMPNGSRTTEGESSACNVHCSNHEINCKINARAVDDDDSLATFYNKAKRKRKCTGEETRQVAKSSKLNGNPEAKTNQTFDMEQRTTAHLLSTVCHPESATASDDDNTLLATFFEKKKRIKRNR